MTQNPQAMPDAQGFFGPGQGQLAGVAEARRIDAQFGQNLNAEQVAELTAALQRERAQFANFKRRSAEEKQGSVAYGKRVLAEKLLPILDDLDRARAHGDLADGPLKAVADKLAAVLTAEELVPFGEPGDPFDPELHEAVQNDGDGTEPVLGAVYRCGYRFGDKVIRTAMVTVTDAPAVSDGE